MIILRKDFYLNLPDLINLSNGLIVKKDHYENHFIARLLRHFNYFKRKQNKGANYDIIKDEENIGFIQLYEDSPGVIEVVFIEISERYRGHHYATEVLKKFIELLRELGYKKMILDAVCDSPIPVHIYKSLGFKMTGKEWKDKDSMEVWGGLVEMEKDLREKTFSKSSFWYSRIV